MPLSRRPHTDQAFDAELQKLRQELLRMASQVEQMIGMATHALIEGDVEAAREVIAMDYAVNAAERAIDDHCIRLLARWQPMAGDLRFIMTAGKMVTDLERIGDLATNVCERAIELHEPGFAGSWEEVPRMAEIVREMLRQAITAFVDGKPKRARKVLKRDDEVDDLYHRLFARLLDRMASGEGDAASLVPVQNAAKYLERIGDHATNLAEQVIFMCKGRDVRHKGKHKPPEGEEPGEAEEA